MKKSKILAFIFVVSAIVSISIMNNASSKYKYKLNSEIGVSTLPFYLETNAADTAIPYSSPTLNIELSNFLNNNYCDKDITYTVSISDGDGIHNNYDFSINGEMVDSTDAEELTLTGGNKNTENLTLTFIRGEGTVPKEESVFITIKSTEPFTKSFSFEVKIVKTGSFEVTGNAVEWTNQPVTLTVEPEEPASIEYYSFDDGETWQSSPSKTFYENESDIKVRTKDKLGSISEVKTVDITKIDTESPVLSVAGDEVIVTLDESNQLNLSLISDDNLSGVDTEDITVLRTGVTITNSNYFTEPGRYAVKYSATDRAGNYSELDTSILVRWPTGGKYVVKRQNVLGTGKALTSTGPGLYKDNAETGLDTSLPYSSKYYYAGKYVNNYVNFANKTFRILNVSVNDDVKLIADLSGSTWQWGDREIYESNIYSNWTEKWWPHGQIYNSDDSQYYVFSETEKAHIPEATFYAGRFSREESTSIATTIEMERTSARELGGDSAAFNGYSAFPNVSDYIKACNAMDTIYSIRTTQTNQYRYADTCWLADGAEQWTMNAKRATALDNDFWVLFGGNEIVSRTYYYPQNYRVVFYIKENTILSGTGTTDDPFTVQEDWHWFDDYQVLQ